MKCIRLTYITYTDEIHLYIKQSLKNLNRILIVYKLLQWKLKMNSFINDYNPFLLQYKNVLIYLSIK